MFEKIKKYAPHILAAGSLSLKALQGYARDLVSFCEKGERLSKGAYKSSVGFESGASLLGGLAIGEGARRLEARFKVPKALRGILPATALTLGVGFVNFCSNWEQNFATSVEQVFKAYAQSLIDLKNYDPRLNPITLTGAVATAYSGARAGFNLVYHGGKALLNSFNGLEDAVDYSDRLRAEREAFAEQ